MGDAGPATLTNQRTPAQPRHLGVEAGLVNEDEPGRIKIGLAVEPILTLLQEVRPLLLQCMRGFFCM